MQSERQLLKQIQKFDQAALAEVYDRYSPEIFRYAWRHLGNEDQAEECVAETFSLFINALERGGGPKNYVRAYLYRIAHNWISDQYRQNPPTLPLDEIQIADPEAGLPEQAQRNHEASAVRAALRLLTAEQRQVIVLKYLEGWRNAEIALAMNKPVGAVKALHHRGIQSLKRILE